MLKAERIKKIYNCPVAELYAGLEIVWHSQREYEDAFMAESTLYTPGLANVKLAAIAAARKMPDGQIRGAEQEELRLQLNEQLYVVLGRWNWLKSYVRHCFTGAHYKPRIEEAGKGHYYRALQKDWEKVLLLLQSGRNFIAKHRALLLVEGGMPPTFEAGFGADADKFETIYHAFMKAKQDAKELTDMKLAANNAIYEDGVRMMRDGRHIFRKQAAVRERFVWRKVRQLIGGDGI